MVVPVAHVPVLLNRCVQLLADPGDSVVVDATLGLGGHSEAILRAYPKVTVLGLDRDPEALAFSRQRLLPFGSRFVAAATVFDESDSVLDELGLGKPVGYLFDLGVSSLQLDRDDRGFSYSRNTRLDMRMDPTTGITAEQVVNDYTPEDLSRVFFKYGEERYARRIAGAIDRRRQGERIVTSDQLTDVIRSAVPPERRRKGHPGKRVFQALRIEVNDELGSLARGLTAAVHRLAVGGNLVVMSYHSLEDRMVKRAFASGLNPPTLPGLPVIPDHAKPFLTPLTRGAEPASEEEIESNGRASSVRLRAVRKVAATPSDWQAAV